MGSLPHSPAAWLAFAFGVAFVTATTTFSIVDGVAIIVGGFAAMLITRTRDLSSLRTPGTILLFGFLVLVALALLFLPKSDLLFGATTLYLGILFLLARFLAARSLTAPLIGGYLVGAGGAAALGIVLLLLPDGVFTTGMFFTSSDRYSFITSDPNVLGALLIPPLLFAAVRLIHPKRGASLALSGLLFIVLLGGILITESRGAYIQGAAALCVLSVLQYKSIRARVRGPQLLALAVCALILMIVYAAATGLGREFASRFTISDAPRLENVTHAASLLRERTLPQLLIGSGNGSYEALSPNGFSAHNLYIRLAVENGFLGVVSFFLFVGSLVYWYLRSTRRNPVSDAVCASIAGILVHSMVIDTLHWRHFWILLGLL